MSEMKRLRRLGEKDYAEVWSIMEQSFPLDERRTMEGQRALLKNPCYRLYGYRRVFRRPKEQKMKTEEL